MVNYSKKKKRIAGHVWLGVFSLFFSLLTVGALYYYNDGFKITVVLEKDFEIDPEESIVINFSLPVLATSIEESFEISPAQKIDFKWENSNKKVSISAQDSWKSETRYNIQIKNGKNILFKKINKNLNFKTKSFPKIASFIPLAGQKNVTVDIEDPIRINFASSIAGYNVKFVVSPYGNLDWQLNEDKTQISLLSKNDFELDTRYAIGVYMKNKKQSAGDYVKIGETSFNTAPPPPPETWDIDPVIRTDQAKKFTQPLIKEGKYIDIDVTRQLMVVFENAVALDAYMISSGKPGMDTPVGSFSIQNKANRVWSKAYSLFMPFWMAILPSGKIGIHELPEWPSGYKEGANHLGIPVSHGCIRLGVGGAKRVFDWAELGTPVIVHE